MTWTKTVPTTSYVLAHRGGLHSEKVRISIGITGIDLEPEDAASLGGYLMEKAKEIEAEALGVPQVDALTLKAVA
jgi:hypothetical protein